MSGDLKQLITREIKSVKEQIRGRMMTDPVQKEFDVVGMSELTWVADVDVGDDDQLLRDVPIKINGPKARFYARRDSPVFLEKNEQGRYQIIGPADRIRQQGSLCILDEDTEITTPSGDIGFTLVTQAFEFYQGPTPPTPGTSFWNDGVHGFPEITKLDSDGNEV